MSHLHLVSDNRAIQHPFRMRREREARRAELGIVGISGGRMLPVPMELYDFIRQSTQFRPADTKAPGDVH